MARAFSLELFAAVHGYVELRWLLKTCALVGKDKMINDGNPRQQADSFIRRR